MKNYVQCIVNNICSKVASKKVWMFLKYDWMKVHWSVSPSFNFYIQWVAVNNKKGYPPGHLIGFLTKNRTKT